MGPQRQSRAHACCYCLCYAFLSLEGCGGDLFVTNNDSAKDAAVLDDATGGDTSIRESATTDRYNGPDGADSRAADAYGGADTADEGPADARLETGTPDVSPHDTGPKADTGIVACDPQEQPAVGVFVSASATGQGNGSKALPYRTIQEGLGSMGSQRLLYLDEGTYPESLTLDNLNAGIVISGGWQRTGAAWSRDCSADARLRTQITSPGPIGLKVGNVSAAVTLRTVSIFSKPKCGSANDKSGESCYGIFVAGATKVLLQAVEVSAGEGGPGGTATTVAPAISVPCNDLISNCSDGADGVTAARPPPGPAGTFTATAYVPGDGIGGSLTRWRRP